MHTPPSRISAVPARHRSLFSMLYTCVFSARGWNPHFSMVFWRTKSGTTMGLNPLLTTFAIAQFMSASSNMAPAPVRYTNREPHTLPPVSKSNIPSLSPKSTWLAASKEKSRFAPTSLRSAASSSPPTGTSGCVSLGTFWPSVWSWNSKSPSVPSSAASLSFSSLPSAIKAARVSGSSLPFIDLALALRSSRISSHSRFRDWNASYSSHTLATSHCAARSSAFACAAAGSSLSFLKSIAARHDSVGVSAVDVSGSFTAAVANRCLREPARARTGRARCGVRGRCHHAWM